MGTQSAVLAGFGVTALIEFQMPQGTDRYLQFVYYIFIIASLAANLNCVSSTTALSVFGTSLALRGPDGAMMRAVEGMYQERKQVFVSFALGLFFMLGGAFVGSWIIMPWEAASLASLIILVCMRRSVPSLPRFPTLPLRSDPRLSKPYIPCPTHLTTAHARQDLLSVSCITTVAYGPRLDEYTCAFPSTRMRALASTISSRRRS